MINRRNQEWGGLAIFSGISEAIGDGSGCLHKLDVTASHYRRRIVGMEWPTRKLETYLFSGCNESRRKSKRTVGGGGGRKGLRYTSYVCADLNSWYA